LLHAGLVDLNPPAGLDLRVEERHPLDLVQGWLILVKRCSTSFSRQRIANIRVM